MLTAKLPPWLFDLVFQQLRVRPQLAALLMTALYRCGRRGDALAVYDTTRRALAGELGLDPGPEMAGLQAKVLVV